MHPTSLLELTVVCWESIILKSTASSRSRIGVVNKCLFWIIHHVWIIMTSTELLSIFQQTLWYLTYNLNKSHKYITYYFHNLITIKTKTKVACKTFLRLEPHTFNWASLRQTCMLLLWIRGKLGSHREFQASHGYTERRCLKTQKHNETKNPSLVSHRQKGMKRKTEMGEAEPRDRWFTIYTRASYRQKSPHLNSWAGS